MFKLAEKFNEILTQDLEVLSTLFNIHNVGFLRIYFNNQYFYTCSNKDLVLDYYQHVKGTEIFFKHKINSYSEKHHCITWPNVPNHYSMNLYLKYNYWNGLTFLEIFKDYVDLWWVTSDIYHNKCDYGSYLELFSKYISFLKAKSSDYLKIIKSNTSGRINTENEKLPVFVDGVNFGALNHMKSFYNNKKLSEREKECLKLLTKGYTAKTIAQELDLSVFSIKTYIQRLKHKINAHYKSDIINFYNKKHPML